MVYLEDGQGVVLSEASLSKRVRTCLNKKVKQTKKHRVHWETTKDFTRTIRREKQIELERQDKTSKSSPSPGKHLGTFTLHSLL